MDLGPLLSVIVWLLVIGGLIMLAIWAGGKLNIPQPFLNIGIVVVVVLAVIIFLTQALPLLGVAL